MRIAWTWFLRRTLRPLSVSLERKEKHTDLKKSSSEQGSTSVDIRQSGWAGLEAE
jgi:hypothetical protein